MAEGQRAASPATSVIVVAIASIAHIRRCLSAIESQRDQAQCELIVAADARLGTLDDLRAEFPTVLFLPNAVAETPVALTAIALLKARGERIVLTEDSCVASRDWLLQLLSSDSRGHGAAGGAVEVSDLVSNSMWAFAYVDFFRYMRPLKTGTTTSLSVCNVIYNAGQLNAIREEWVDGFHETVVHRVLETRFGPLFLNPGAVVQVNRNVALRDAIHERYAFGKLFGATRILRSSFWRRLSFAVLSLGLPLLLTARMAAKASSDRKLFSRFTRALPIVLVLVLAWSWGEWLGYVTGRLPRSTTTAPELTA